MRQFLYFSNSAATSGKALSEGDLMKAGRMDIAIHSFIQGIFLSHGFRKDVTFHFVFYGMPDPPKHIEITVTDELEISKKDVGNLIKKILYKYRPGEKTGVFPGCFIEKKSFLNVIEEILQKDTKCFILGDHDGLPKKEMKRLKKIMTPVSIGPKIYFASQTIAVVNNELDFRGL